MVPQPEFNICNPHELRKEHIYSCPLSSSTHGHVVSSVSTMIVHTSTHMHTISIVPIWFLVWYVRKIFEKFKKMYICGNQNVAYFYHPKVSL